MSAEAKLLCRFTSSYREGVYPYGVCTHFIYASVPNHPSAENRRHKDVLYSYDPNAFRKFLHVRETAPDVRLLLSVDVEAMLRTGWSAQRLAKDARVWLDRSGVDGLHLSGLDLLPRSIHNVLGIITALRASFRDRYLITIGVDRTQKTVEQDLLAILRTVDFASFQTSRVRHTDARTTLVNPYGKYENSTSTFFFNYEVERLAQLAAKEPKSRVCFTLTLGGNQFELEDATQHGLGAPAKHTKDVSYSEICKRDWDEVKYIAPALGFYAHKGKTWVGYDTEKTIASKVRKALERYPGFCVMLVQVDRDDYEGACSEKHFPLAQSVKQALLQPHRTRSR
ncbi:chitinase-3-like protein 1 [Ixodes scapularis]|uniref:chitinase-3-like protein 1 n=1 Tax=Ixodes scapularis TaxID=6945 RepID=UPI001C386FBC|nr:chitinase-3-like protein 1 [Ixodes scapularis]